MANREKREALRGAEEEMFDLLSRFLTSEKWAELLRAPLELAARMGKRGLARMLVEAGAEMGEALHRAALFNRVGTVNDLLEGEASVIATDRDGMTPLHFAADRGKPEMVQLLMLKGADKDAVDESGRTPLYMAICSGHVPATLALLAGGADVNLQCGSENWTVVQLAVCQGQDMLEFVKGAIEHGANFDAFDIHHNTALHVAAIRNTAVTIDVLIEGGANIEARNGFGCTPPHTATCTAASLDSLVALLKHGAVNARGIHQQTPLHIVARIAGTQGAADMVDALLRWGADETMLSKDGETAVDVVGTDVQEEDSIAQDAERVRKLLVNAPADRAWRRRGYLVLCRARPNRMQLVQDSSSAPPCVARKTRSAAKLTKTEASGCHDPAEGGAVNGGTNGDWAGVVARVLGLQEEGLFRAIVGYV